MTVFGLCSIKGAPGVTTLALTLAGVWPRGRAVVVESDPDGGVIAARYQLGANPGLLSLAVDARSTPTAGMFTDHTQDLGDDVRAVVAPLDTEAIRQALNAPYLHEALHQSDGDVLVDAGRISPSTPALTLLRSADRVVFVLRPTLDVLRQVPNRADLLDPAKVALVLIGEAPYTATQVERVLTLPVVGVIADDPRAAEAMSGGRQSPRTVRRSPLVRTARRTAERLVTDAEARPGDVHSPKGAEATCPTPVEVRR